MIDNHTAFINDANILIDLIKIDLINPWMTAKLKLKTTDFVLAELRDDQRLLVDDFVAQGLLDVIETDDLGHIYDMAKEQKGLSVQDCSVWYYAKKHKGILLTGDQGLRRKASNDGVDVKGILYMFDLLLELKQISPTQAHQKLSDLRQINNRLPGKPIQERLALWEKL